MNKIFTSRDIIVSSGPGEMLSIVSLLSLVLVSILAPSILLRFSILAPSILLRSCPEVIVLVVGVS